MNMIDNPISKIHSELIADLNSMEFGALREYLTATGRKVVIEDGCIVSVCRK